MIKLFFANTPNVFKVSIALEELKLESERVPVDLMKGGQFDPAFLKISPNNRVPAIIDTAPADGGEPISVFESAAILIYLAEKQKKLLPEDPRRKAAVLKWVMWQIAGQGPVLGQLGHFMYYVSNPDPYVLTRFRNEARRLCRVLDTQLANSEFLAGEYSIADIICYPWYLFRHHHQIDLEEFPSLQRWFSAIDERPAVRRALADAQIPAPVQLSEAARSILFPQTPP